MTVDYKRNVYTARCPDRASARWRMRVWAFRWRRSTAGASISRSAEGISAVLRSGISGWRDRALCPLAGGSRAARRIGLELWVAPAISPSPCCCERGVVEAHQPSSAIAAVAVLTSSLWNPRAREGRAASRPTRTTRKLADDGSNFCSQIGDTALVTCTDRPPTAAGRILRYLIHRHRITNRQELGLRELA